MDDKHSKNGWDRIGGIRSKSNPAKMYVIGLRTTGYLGCDCPSWIYKKGVEDCDGFKETCKHIRSLLLETVAANDLDLTTFGLTWLGKRYAAKRAKAKAQAA